VLTLTAKPVVSTDYRRPLQGGNIPTSFLLGWGYGFKSCPEDNLSKLIFLAPLLRRYLMSGFCTEIG
jgi:hypothetical protein